MTNRQKLATIILGGLLALVFGFAIYAWYTGLASNVHEQHVPYEPKQRPCNNCLPQKLSI